MQSDKNRLTEIGGEWHDAAWMYVSLVNVLIGGNLFLHELYLEVPSYQKA